MNSNSLYRGNLISFAGPGYPSSHSFLVFQPARRALCKHSTLKVFYGFHLLLLGDAWLAPAPCKFLIKLPPNVLSHLFSTIETRNSLFMGVQMVGHRKRKYEEKIHCTGTIIWVWAISFDSTSIVLKKVRETWWKRKFYTALRLSLTDCVKGKWYWDKAAFFDLESIPSGSRNICHEVRNNTWLFHYIYLIKYLSFM